MDSFKAKLLHSSLLTIFSLLLPHQTYAAIVPTAIGNINTNTANFTNDILRIAFGMAGGIAFIVLVFGAFKVLASRGDPDSLQAGREVITSALAGLLFIMLSILILRTVSIDILGLPFS